jgi:hypothetical protein
MGGGNRFISVVVVGWASTMPIYDRSTVELMRQLVAERPDQHVFTADEIYAWFKEHWPKIKRGTVQ